MSEWQRMETAPKDMRPILVFEPGSCIGGFKEEPDMMWIAWRKSDRGWVRQCDDHMYVEATHWMPLPPKPE